MKVDEKTLADLVAFARVEVASRDVEPWADMFKVVYEERLLPPEEAIWLTTLYNTYDRVDSALAVFNRWPTPWHWAGDPKRDEARNFPCAQERRNLHGGKVNRRHAGYVESLAGCDQLGWMLKILEFESPGEDFKLLTAHMRTIWGVGRQAAFEWAEFAGKCFGLPVDAADGQLWESSGPRQSLEALYDCRTQAELDWAAYECKEHLADAGIPLKWVDFETIICDFKVMVRGRYFPGRHITMLKAEVAGNEMLTYAFNKVVPPEWASIPAGIDMDPHLRGLYKQTGKILEEPWW